MQQDKNKIVEIAAQLFRQSGIRNNTMDDIACQAGLSKKTLYQQVAQKEALVAAVIEQEYLTTKTSIEIINKNSTDNVEALIKISALILAYLKNTNPIAIIDLKKLYQATYSKAVEDFRNLYTIAIVGQLSTGKAVGTVRSDINEQLIAQLYTDKIDQMQTTTEFWGKNLRSEEIIREMITYYMRGLVTKKGETLFNKHILKLNTYLNQ